MLSMLVPMTEIDDLAFFRESCEAGLMGELPPSNAMMVLRREGLFVDHTGGPIDDARAPPPSSSPLECPCSSSNCPWDCVWMWLQVHEQSCLQVRLHQEWKG